MTTRQCQSWIASQVAELDQVRAGLCAVIVTMDELIVQTGVGGDWDAVNARIIKARHDADKMLAWLEERTQTLEDVLRQLDEERDRR